MNQIDEKFREFCKGMGWKCTAQRRAVYSFLHGNTAHPTVESVWQDVRGALPDVSLDSVYRILKDFADAGLLRRLDSGDAMRFDPDTSPHDHFLCSECGQVYDFRFLDEAGARRACASVGVARSVELQVRGVCNACLNRSITK